MENRNKLIEEIATDFVMLKRRMMGHSHNHHDRLGERLTPVQAQLLFLVHQHDGITTSEIAKLLATTASAVTQLIDCLVEKGFLVREMDLSDRRIYLIKISPQAGAQLSRMKAQGLKQIGTIFEVLNDDELLVYKELTKKIINAASDDENAKDAHPQ